MGGFEPGAAANYGYRITKAALAERMKTSRAQVDRILKAKGNVTIESLQRAAGLLGRELRIELV